MTEARVTLAPAAFLGMGIMGGSMSANLARTGCQVKVWNRTPGRPGAETAAAQGAAVCQSLAAAVADVDMIFTCLGDVEDVEAVLLGEGGVSDFARKGAIIVDTTTIGPEAARSISSRLAERGLKFVDAPITGGDIGAREGTLTIMCGGEEEDYKRALPYLMLMGRNIYHCGPTGSGQALKLCNQALCAIGTLAISESLDLAERLGIDPRMVVDCLQGGAGGSWALTNLAPRVVNNDLKPGFMLRHMIKDLRLIHENLPADGDAGKDQPSSSGPKGAGDGFPLPATAMAEELFKQVAASRPGADSELGTHAVILAYRK